MAQEIILSSPSFIKSITNIGDNMSDKFLQPAIREAQQIDLQGIIGTSMLKKLQALVYSGDILLPDNAPYKNLLDECQYFLAYTVLSRLVITSTFHFNNYGVNTTQDDNVNTPAFEDLSAVQGYYEKRADAYCDLLQKYIIAHKDELPEISDSCCKAVQANLDSAAQCAIFLGGKRSRIIR